MIGHRKATPSSPSQQAEHETEGKSGVNSQVGVASDSSSPSSAELMSQNVQEPRDGGQDQVGQRLGTKNRRLERVQWRPLSIWLFLVLSYGCPWLWGELQGGVW